MLRRSLPILLLIAACDTNGDDGARASDTGSTPVAAGDTLSADGDTSTNGTDPAAAQAVIRDYYAAISAGDYRRAYMLWGDSGRRSEQTFEEFRAGFANTGSVDVSVGEPGRIEGAAGSRYITIPVEITDHAKSGGVQRFGGTYTLRRSVVDGATELQRRWHLYDSAITARTSDNSAAGARAIVERFGARLRMVSVLGPREQFAAAIREQYGPLVSEDLLGQWSLDPSTAPGRKVSSPWPRGIEITDVRNDGENARVVTGRILYVTNADTSSVVERVPVRIDVTRGADQRWRISNVEM